jgi:GT2 family glycosyltransferase
MISVVYSTRKDNPEFKEHLNKTTKTDLEILQYINNGEYSLTELYNKGLDEASNDIIVFCHDDIILKDGWDKKLITHFKNTDYGILGMAGTTDIDESGQWWKDNTKMVGIVKHSSDGKTWESKYSNNFGSDIIETVMLDGLFFAVHKDRIKKRFNEDIKGFHFYDFDFTFGNHLEGVKVGVMFDIKITHKSVGATNEQWNQNRLQFCNLYADHLPYNLPVDIKYEKEVSKLPKKFPSVAIIIPTKGNVDMLKDCIDSIWENDKYLNMKVYIADTGSTDEEKERIKQDIIFRHSLMSDRPRTVELLEYNYYNFASINNHVVRNHVGAEELLLFCNNDIKLVNDAITRMVNVYNQNKKGVGTIGARLHFGDNTIQHSGISVFLNRQPQTGAYFPALTHHGLRSYYTYHDGKKEVLGNTAAFMMINKDLFNKIGGFSEDYNECFEDVHLNIDCLNYNRKNIFVGDAVCYHLESQTRNKDGEKQRRESEDYTQRIIPYILQNKKTYNYFSNVKPDVLTQILAQQTREINTMIK